MIDRAFVYVHGAAENEKKEKRKRNYSKKKEEVGEKMSDELDLDSMLRR
jgi:hypothetical protein